jgi:hypothetical protein
LLLAFASTIILGFSLLEIHDQDIDSLLDTYMFRNGAFCLTRRGVWSFYVGAAFVAPQFQHEYIRAVTAFRSIWRYMKSALCIILLLSNETTSHVH